MPSGFWGRLLVCFPSGLVLHGMEVLLARAQLAPQRLVLGESGLHRALAGLAKRNPGEVFFSFSLFFLNTNPAGWGLPGGSIQAKFE